MVNFIYKLTCLIISIITVSIMVKIIMDSMNDYSVRKITGNKYFISEHVISSSGEPLSYIYCFRNTNTNKTVGELLQKFKIDERINTVYLITKNNIKEDRIEYFILNYKNDKLYKYLNLEDMEPKNKIIFEEKDGWLIPNLQS